MPPELPQQSSTQVIQKQSYWRSLQEKQRDHAIHENDVDFEVFLQSSSSIADEFSWDPDQKEWLPNPNYSKLSEEERAFAIICRCKALRGLAMRTQVRLARLMSPVRFEPGSTVFKAGDADPRQKKFIIVESGEVEILIPDQSSPTGLHSVGVFGVGTLIGGLFAMELSSKSFMTARVPNDDKKPTKTFPSGVGGGPPQIPPAAAFAKPLSVDAKEGARTGVALTGFEVTDAVLQEFRMTSKADWVDLKRRVMLALRYDLNSHVEYLLARCGFFSCYVQDFIQHLAKECDLRLFMPGDIIFKEKSMGKSMAVLILGSVNIFQQGRKYLSNNNPGFEFGETALLENGSVRRNTVRCGTEGEALVVMVSRDLFTTALDSFPAENQKLQECARRRQILLTLQHYFDCDLQFLRLLASYCELEYFNWGASICQADQGEEMLTLVVQGDVIVNDETASQPSSSTHQSGSRKIHGLEAALGLRSGRPRYELVAGRGGCSIVRMSWAMLEKALHYFPSQLTELLKMVGLKAAPANHPFFEKNIDQWSLSLMRSLLSQALCSLSVTMDDCRAFLPHLRMKTYDAGSEMVQEGRPSDSLAMLVMGAVLQYRGSIVTTTAKAPQYFDADCLLSPKDKVGVSEATLTAITTSVVWYLPVDALHRAPGLGASGTTAGAMEQLKSGSGTQQQSCQGDGGAGSMIGQLLRDMAEERASIQKNLQARLRNMQTFRKFNSNVLGFLCEHLDLRHFLPDQLIFSQGDEGDPFIYMIIRGSVEVQCRGRKDLLSEGSSFGEMVLFGEKARVATVKAANFCVINAVHVDLVRYAFTVYPDSYCSTQLQQSERIRCKPSETRSLQKAREKTSNDFIPTKALEAWLQQISKHIPLEGDVTEDDNESKEMQRRERLAMESSSLPAVPVPPTPNPRKTKHRAQRSALYAKHSPRLPPVERSLYHATPRVAQVKIECNFGSMPPSDPAKAARGLLGIQDSSGTTPQAKGQQLSKSNISGNGHRAKFLSAHVSGLATMLQDYRDDKLIEIADIVLKQSLPPLQPGNPDGGKYGQHLRSVAREYGLSKLLDKALPPLEGRQHHSPTVDGTSLSWQSQGRTSPEDVSAEPALAESENQQEKKTEKVGWATLRAKTMKQHEQSAPSWLQVARSLSLIHLQDHEFDNATREAANDIGDAKATEVDDHARVTEAAETDDQTHAQAKAVDATDEENCTPGSSVECEESKVSSANVKLRARHLLAEGAATGKLRWALEKISTKTRPSILDVKARARTLLVEGARTGSLKTALKEIPKTPLPSRQEIKARARRLLMEAVKTGALITALKEMPEEISKTVSRRFQAPNLIRQKTEWDPGLDFLSEYTPALTQKSLTQSTFFRSPEALLPLPGPPGLSSAFSLLLWPSSWRSPAADRDVYGWTASVLRGQRLRAECDYAALAEDELSFASGDVITVLAEDSKDAGWCWGSLQGQQGFFPLCHVEPASEDRKRILVRNGQRVQAIYSHEAVDDDSDVLSFEPDDIITVVEEDKVDENWCHGILGDKRGLFLLDHVQPMIEDEMRMTMSSFRSQTSYGKSSGEADTKTMFFNALRIHADPDKFEVVAGQRVRAVFPHEPADDADNELSFKPGDTITVVEEDGVVKGWCHGIRAGKKGIFPLAHVKPVPEEKRRAVLERLPDFVSAVDQINIQATYQAKVLNALFLHADPEHFEVVAGQRVRAIFSYEPADDAGDELSFKEGDIIIVVEEDKTDKGWCHGILRGKRGLFPLAYVLAILL